MPEQSTRTADPIVRGGSSDVPSGAVQPINLRHATPATTIYAGTRAVAALDRELGRAGYRAVVIVHSASLAETDSLATIVQVLSDRVASTFGDVQRYSPTEVVKALADVLHRKQADAVVVVGGGSAMVTARAAAALAGEQRPLSDLLTRRDADGKVVNPSMPRPKIPVWVIPSTPTPAMAKAGAALRDSVTGERVAVFDPKARAQGLILDPATLSTSPTALFVATAMNGLSMGVEGLLATGADPFAEALLAQGVRDIVTHLPAITLQNEPWEPRARVAMGAILVGQGTDYSGAGLALALSHEIAPRSVVAGGVIELILLPHTVRFTGAAVPDRLPVVAAALGAPEPTADSIAARLRDVATDWGLPTQLRETGVSPSDLQMALQHAVGDWAMNARMPRRADVDDLTAIADAAW